MRQAKEVDPSYGTSLRSAGYWYLQKGRLLQARRAFSRATTVDPGDVSALVGVGLVAIRERKWSEAEHSLRGAIEMDDQCVDAHRALSEVLIHERNYAKAIRALETSLRLAVRGYRQVSDVIATGGIERQHGPWDPQHGQVHAKVAQLYAATNRWPEAIAGYVMAIGARFENSSVWGKLAQAYWRVGDRRRSLHALRHGLRCWPADVVVAARSLWGRAGWTAITSRTNSRLEKRAGREAGIWV